MRFGERVSTFFGVILEQNKSKTSPHKFCTIFRVLELKTLKIRRGAARKKGRWLGAFIAIGITEAGTIRKTASVNHILTEAVALHRLPRLMD
jgi:hypothetical protein